MPPIYETEAQRKARLNPTPVQVQSPANTGYFRAVGDYGTAIYKMNPDGRTYQSYDILNELGGGGASGNAGGQAGVAKQKLQQQYGIDWNALPEQNLGDLLYSGKSASGNPFTDRATPVRGSLSDLFQSQPTATFGSKFINTEPNKLAPVTTLSSLNGQKTVDENNKKLEGLQQAYQYVDAKGNLQTVSAGSPEEAMKNAPNIDPHSGVMLLKPPTNNPAQASIINSVNQGIQSGNASPQDIQNYSSAMDTQGSIFKDISLADAAKQSGNYSEMDFLLKRVADNTKLFNEQLSQLHADQKALREKSLQLMTPGAREQELAKQVTDIKGQIDQFKIQTEEDKFKEYEGQTMGFAGGRASEIDIRAQFKLQRMATEANTLLTELGLEQDARKMQAGATDKQLTYLKDDFELQQKVQDKITAMEDDVFNAAKDLRTEAKSTLSTILNMLEGVNPNEIPAQTKSQLVSLANQSGVPLELIEQGLKTQWAQKVFDNALKTRQEDRLSQNQKDSDSGPKTEEERKFQADLLTDMKTYKSKAEYLRDLETGKAAIVARIGQGGYNTIKNEAERYFASPSSILLGQGSAEAPDFSQFTFGEVPQTGGFFSNLFR